MSKPRLILDTNIFLVSLAPNYKYYWIYQSLIQNKFDLVVSNEILTDYQGADCALQFKNTLSNANLQKSDGILACADQRSMLDYLSAEHTPLRFWLSQQTRA